MAAERSAETPRTILTLPAVVKLSQEHDRSPAGVRCIMRVVLSGDRGWSRQRRVRWHDFPVIADGTGLGERPGGWVPSGATCKWCGVAVEATSSAGMVR